MNHVITPCHSLGPEKMPGAWAMLRSLRHHSPATRIHVLTGPDMARDKFPTDVEFENIQMPGDDPQVWINTMATMDGSAYGIANTDRVMTSDIRDVVFQADPFVTDIATGDKVDLFAEDRHHDCDTERANSIWQANLHRGKIPDKIKGKPILCFGTLAGFWYHLQDHFYQLDKWMSCTSVFYGRDQAMNTSMGHCYPQRYRIHANEDGPVLTCALLQRLEVRGNPVRLYNERSQLPPVIHQYDRLQDLAEKIIKEWVP